MKLKILLVDDEKDLLNILPFYLKKEGYDIEEAANGLEAFEKTQTWHPNLIISDIQMPLCNGLQLLEMVRTLPPPPIPFLFISGYAGSDLMASTQLKEIQHFISKPFKIKILLDKVKSLSSSPLDIAVGH